VIQYLNDWHSLDVRGPLERILRAADLWAEKLDAVVAYGKKKYPDSEAAAASARELAEFTDAGLPEQKRLHLDLRIAEGAFWRARFPLESRCSGPARPFLIRRLVVHWTVWIRDAFSDAIRDWSLPDESEIFSQSGGEDGTWTGFLESPERWELAEVIMPRYIPDTDETPRKLAIEEARRLGDLPVALPLIKRLDEEVEAFVTEAVRWPRGNLQPARTEHLFRAVNELRDLVGTDTSESAPEAPSNTPAELLNVLYVVQFRGYVRMHTAEEWERLWTTGELARLRRPEDVGTCPIPPLDAMGLDEVPDYLLEAILATRGVEGTDFKNALRLLEARGDIRPTQRDNWYGRWCTGDGHVIVVSYVNGPLPPLKPPFHAIVTLDGAEFKTFAGFKEPIGQGYALTAEGIRRAEAPMGIRPAHTSAQPSTQTRPVQPPPADLEGGVGPPAEPQAGPRVPPRALEAGEHRNNHIVAPDLGARLKPSHRRAKALYDWAMEHIEGAESMTYRQLFEKLTSHPDCNGEGLPGNADTFARYCRAAGIRRNTPVGSKGATRTVRRASDL
jgi:hypothetical protein